MGKNINPAIEKIGKLKIFFPYGLYVGQYYVKFLGYNNGTVMIGENVSVLRWNRLKYLVKKYYDVWNIQVIQQK